MTTEAQVTANRLNAQRSTGPRTTEGKAAVALNAVKHGLRAQMVVLPGEAEDEYARFCEEMMEDLRPQGLSEREVAERIVGLAWRLRRAGRYHDAVFAALYEQQVAALADTSSEAGDPGAADRVLGQMLLADFSGPRVLERVQLYERRIENGLFRARAEWDTLRGRPRVSEKRPTMPFAGGRDIPAARTPDGVTGAPNARVSVGDPATNLSGGALCQTKPRGPEPAGGRGLGGTNKPNRDTLPAGRQVAVNKQSQWDRQAVRVPGLIGANKPNLGDQISLLAGLSLPKWRREELALAGL
jgi:hypothetical protein